MVAQVDEDQPAMIAPAIDPARQADSLSNILFAKLAAGMGAIGVHGKPLKIRGNGRVFGGLWQAGQGRTGPSLLAGFSRPAGRLTSVIKGDS
jgi:hypothetical protein